ncbi:MAG: hypothetical protein GY809_14305 [Planctomycetes bacterium]|nr:hypothetical protein [Planctomycetota bacterium]
MSINKNTGWMAVFVLCMVGLWISAAVAADWPHWRGPDYNGMSRETVPNPAVLKDGIEPVWEAQIGVGFSSVTISHVLADGKIYSKDAKGHLVCIDISGKASTASASP